MPELSSDNQSTEPAKSNGSAASPAQPAPAMPPPSAMVQPFDSGGTLPHTESQIKKKSAKGIIIALVVLLVLAGGAYAYAVYGNPLEPKKAATASPAPTPADPTVDLAAPLQSLDASLGDLDTNLKDTDTTLGDKSGDLSE